MYLEYFICHGSLYLWLRSYWGTNSFFIKLASAVQRRKYATGCFLFVLIVPCLKSFNVRATFCYVACLFRIRIGSVVRDLCTSTGGTVSWKSCGSLDKDKHTYLNTVIGCISLVQPMLSMFKLLSIFPLIFYIFRLFWWFVFHKGFTKCTHWLIGDW